MIRVNTTILKIFTLLLSVFISISFYSQEKDIKIQGTVKNATDKTLYLQHFKNNKRVNLDSVKLNKKGKFKMKLTVDTEHFYSLSFSESEYALLVLDSKTAAKKIKVSADDNDFINTFTIQGSQPSLEISNFTKEVYSHKTKKDSINKIIYSSTSLDEKQQLKLASDQIDKDFIAYRNQFIEKNKNSIASIVSISYIQYSIPEELDQIRKIEKGLSETCPNSEYYKGVKTQLAQIETQLKIQKEEAQRKAAAEKKSAIGSIAPELNFPSPSGEIITLKSLRGNYVLIDFWASWCRPCRAENPNVVKAYKKYHEDGFTVYSVSLDKSKARWESAIAQDGLIWPNHVSDLKQWQSAATGLYGFRGIPHTVLIDKEGRIIAKNLRGVALERKLVEIFGH